MTQPISRNTFQRTLKNGVDLTSEALKDGLKGTSVTVDQLRALDANNDGTLKGAELNGAFKLADSFDQNGSAASFKNEGEAGAVYAALKAGRHEGPYFGQAIAAAALDRAGKDKEGYAFSNAPTSPYENLSGNKVPGETRPSWLKNNNKCNQFVGDALTQAGIKMPTFKMTDGTEHYVNAERLPNYRNHFDRVTSPADIRVGDVFVKDYPAVGESTAHTEVITGSDGKGNLRTTGAHGDGAYEMERPGFFDGAKYNEAGFWEKDGDKIYILRPKMQADELKLAARPIRP